MMVVSYWMLHTTGRNRGREKEQGK